MIRADVEGISFKDDKIFLLHCDGSCTTYEVTIDMSEENCNESEDNNITKQHVDTLRYLVSKLLVGDVINVPTYNKVEIVYNDKERKLIVGTIDNNRRAWFWEYDELIHDLFECNLFTILESTSLEK